MTKSEIIAQADIYKTAQEIGIPTKIRGKNIQIICPGHEHHMGKKDGNFGSCVLTDHGYHCFAANCTVGIVQMVQEQSELNGRKMSKTEALHFICKVNNFVLDESEKDQNPFPFSQEELYSIGYKKPFVNKEMEIYHFQPEYYQDKYYQTIQMKKEKVKIETQTLYRLWHIAPMECLNIIKETTSKELEKTSTLIKTIKENPMFLSKQIENQEQDFIYLFEQIKVREEKLKNLMNKIFFLMKKQSA